MSLLDSAKQILDNKISDFFGGEVNPPRRELTREQQELVDQIRQHLDGYSPDGGPGSYSKDMYGKLNGKVVRKTFNKGERRMLVKLLRKYNLLTVKKIDGLWNYHLINNNNLGSIAGSLAGSIISNLFKIVLGDKSIKETINSEMKDIIDAKTPIASTGIFLKTFPLSITPYAKGFGYLDKYVKDNKAFILWLTNKSLYHNFVMFNLVKFDKSKVNKKKGVMSFNMSSMVKLENVIYELNTGYDLQTYIEYMFNIYKREHNDNGVFTNDKVAEFYLMNAKDTRVKGEPPMTSTGSIIYDEGFDINSWNKKYQTQASGFINDILASVL